MNNERIRGLDILKCLCAFLVVSIHITFPGQFGEYFKALARIAVPIFFMITGYFYHQSIIHKHEKEHVLKILKLTLCSNLFYFLLCGLSAFANGEIRSYLTGLFTAKTILKFLLFNESPVAGHLWYLGALLYVLLLVDLMGKKMNISTCSYKIRGGYYLLIIFLLASDLILGKYSILLFGHEFPNIVARNWLFVGLPYFMIGGVLNGKKLEHISKRTLCVLVIVFSVTTIFERYILVSLGSNAVRDHYISTTFLAVSVFLLFIDIVCVGGIKDALAVIGRDYSTIIYIIHPAFISVYAVIIRKLNRLVTGIDNIYELLAPVIVFLSALSFAVVYKKLLHSGSRSISCSSRNKNELK